MNEPLPPIPLTPVQSSNVVAIGYDPASRTARVRFRNGATYRYADVPPELHESIMKADSVGAAVRQLRSYNTIQEPVEDL